MNQNSVLKVFFNNPSIETVQHFFMVIDPLLRLCYRSIDKLNAKMGRPPTDYRFQFRFLLWWKICKPGSLIDAIEILNGSPPLQFILGAPEKAYSRSAFYRFKKKFKSANYHKLALWVLMVCIKEKFLDVSKAVIDSFPVYSYLNTQKCLRRPKIDRKLVKKFFSLLDLKPILLLIPPDHKRAKPTEDKLRCLLFYFIWDGLSIKKIHKTIFEKEKLYTLLGLSSTWKSPTTLSNFIKKLKSLENFEEIEKALLQAVISAWIKIEEFSPKQTFPTIESLIQTFHTPHRYKDKGITLNYCAAKDQTFYGRGGLLLGDAETYTPLLVALTPKYKQNEEGIKEFLLTAKKELKGLLKNTEIIGDAEFGTEEIILTIITELEAYAAVEMYGNKKDKIPLSSETQKLRKRVETIIGRLVNQYDIEHPQCLGTEAVDSVLQEISLCDLLVFYYNHKIGNKENPHSIKALRI